MMNEESATCPAFFILPSSFYLGLGFRFGLAEAGDAVAGFPLAAFLEEFGALKTLEHITFAAQCGGRAQTAML
jgi:hypothetical protein